MWHHLRVFDIFKQDLKTEGEEFDCECCCPCPCFVGEEVDCERCYPCHASGDQEIIKAAPPVLKRLPHSVGP